jgi:phage shock protein E
MRRPAHARHSSGGASVRRALFAVMLAATGCSRPAQPQPQAQASDQAVAVTPAKDPAAARSLIAAGAAVIDVRTADEYNDDHLAKAVNIPIEELPGRLAEVGALVQGNKTRPVVVYCASGSRAAKAKHLLDEAGYAQVVNGGGVDDLRDPAASPAK